MHGKVWSASSGVVPMSWMGSRHTAQSDGAVLAMVLGDGALADWQAESLSKVASMHRLCCERHRWAMGMEWQDMLDKCSLGKLTLTSTSIWLQFDPNLTSRQSTFKIWQFFDNFLTIFFWHDHPLPRSLLFLLLFSLMLFFGIHVHTGYYYKFSTTNTIIKKKKKTWISSAFTWGQWLGRRGRRRGWYVALLLSFSLFHNKDIFILVLDIL